MLAGETVRARTWECPQVEWRKNRGEEMTSQTTGTKMSSQHLPTLEKIKFLEVQSIVAKVITLC